jgi:hypothetical protein
MKKTIIVGAATLALLVPLGGQALATTNPTTGQPAKTCLDPGATTEPGSAATAPGSAFNEPSDTSSGGTAGAVYAGNGISATTAGSTAAVSQYDVACYQVTQNS